MYAPEDLYIFPPTRVGESCTLKVNLRNNSFKTHVVSLTDFILNTFSWVLLAIQLQCFFLILTEDCNSTSLSLLVSKVNIIFEEFCSPVIFLFSFVWISECICNIFATEKIIDYSLHRFVFILIFFFFSTSLKYWDVNFSYYAQIWPWFLFKPWVSVKLYL